MRRKPVKFRMALRGRTGFLTYLVIGTLLFVALFYAWNSVFPPSARVTYSSRYLGRGKLPETWQQQQKVDKFRQQLQVQQHQPQGVVVQEPPSALNREQEVKDEIENWRKQKVEEDGRGEDLAAREEAEREKEALRQTLGRDQSSYPLLQQPADPEDGDYFRNMARLVHLDFKGAPPLVSYLEKLFPVLRSLGATGLLMEYEDMFPYSGNLSILAAENAYSTSDLQRIQTAAKRSGLEIIPLVQTFGHMEFVLKHGQFRYLRENDFTPQVISPVNEGSYKLINSMIAQVLRAHPDATRIHIGCDEVYGLGQGQSQSVIAKQNIQPRRLFLSHVAKVASYVQANFKVQPLIWDDWIRETTEQDIQASKINKLVEPMVWCYTQDILPRVSVEVWLKYGRLFPGVWVASAFKGATGPSQYITNATYHLKNNLQFVSIMRDLGRKRHVVNFRGLALTGWQRFDHFAVLCELLPVGLPSLAVCLQAVHNGGFDKRVHKQASSLLNCSGSFDLSPNSKVNVSRNCSFPGSDVYYAVQQLHGIVVKFTKEEGVQGRLTGWLADYNIHHNFVSPGQMMVLISKVSKLLNESNLLAGPIREHLTKIYDSKTVEEWMETNVESRKHEMESILDRAKAQLTRKTWGSRYALDEGVKSLQKDGTTGQQLLQAGGQGGLQFGNVKGEVRVHPISSRIVTPQEIPGANQQRNFPRPQEAKQSADFQPPAGGIGSVVPQGPRAADTLNNQAMMGQAGRIYSYNSPAGRINSSFDPSGRINSYQNPPGSIGRNQNPSGSINSNLNQAGAFGSNSNVGQSNFGANGGGLGGQQGGKLSQTFLRNPAYPNMPSGPSKLSVGDLPAQNLPQRMDSQWNAGLNLPQGQQRLPVDPMKSALSNPERLGSQFLQSFKDRQAALQAAGGSDQVNTQRPDLRLAAAQNRGIGPAGPEKRPSSFMKDNKAQEAVPGYKVLDSGPVPTADARKEENTETHTIPAVKNWPGGDDAKQQLPRNKQPDRAHELKFEKERMPAGEREDQNDQEGQGMLDSFTGRGKHVVKDTANGQQVGVKKADGQGINSNIAANQKDDKDYKDYEDDDETF